MPLTPYEFEPDPSLFNKHAFRQQLAKAKSSISLFKQTIKSVQDKLDQRFLDGADIRDLVHGRAWFIDQLLSVVWEQFEWPDNNISLLAVHHSSLFRLSVSESEDFTALVNID